MRVITGAIQRTVQLTFLLHALGELTLGTSVEHDDDRADHLQMAQFFGGNVQQKVFAPRIFFSQGLGEIAGCCGQFAIGAPELFQQQIGQTRIGLGHANGVLKSLVMYEHSNFPQTRLSRFFPGWALAHA